MAVDEYDKITAYHYSAYRPPLHTLILRNYLRKRRFKNGLDIGCGTGLSSVALKHFCKTTVGIDPSTSMLSKTIPTTGISYEHFDGEHLNFNPGIFDIITLAGSWWYGKSQILLDEIQKVGTSEAQAIIYDFEVLFAPIYNALDLNIPSSSNDYEHFVDFLNFDSSDFGLITKESQEISLKITAKELGHLLCSEKKVLNLLKVKYKTSNIFEELIHELNKIYLKDEIKILAKSYYTDYSIIKK